MLSAGALQRTRACLPSELLAYSFHTSATLYGIKPGPKASNVPLRRRADSVKQSKPLAPGKVLQQMFVDNGIELLQVSRTRLSKEYTPKKTTRLQPKLRREESPRQPFERDSVPHKDARDKTKDSKVIRQRRPDSSVRQPDRKSAYAPRDRFGVRKGKDATSPPSPMQLPPALRLSVDGPNRNTPPKPPKVENPLINEFDMNTKAESNHALPSEFTSPPLMEGLLSSVEDALGAIAKPTPIQALSLRHLFSPPREPAKWRQYLLAAETGSGKSLAYMLPMLNDLKTSELAGTAPENSTENGKQTMYNPRAIVLAPTHELSRQLSATAKSLLHNIKLRVICASRANNSHPARVTTSKLSTQFSDEPTESGPIRGGFKPVDVLVGTPTKLLDMVRGHGWNWDKAVEDYDELGQRLRRKFVVGEPEVGLHRVEWVIVDEADVLFGMSFTTFRRVFVC
jgi:ATP-dependent RNA helicase MRH4, mitochondrial